MPQTAAELVSLLDLEEIEVGLFRGRHPDTTWQRTFGGQVLAQSLVAASRSVDDGRVVHSLNAYFLRPGRTDSPIIYDVERLRDGGSFSVRRVVARQGGAVIFALNCSFHRLEPGLAHHDPFPAGVPDPDECPTMAEALARMYGRAPAMLHEWDALEVRVAGDADRIEKADPRGHIAHMRVWVKTTEALPDDPGLHQALLAYLSDMTLLSVATVPHEVAFLSPTLQVASIDHAMYFHRPVRVDEWLLYDQVSPSASYALGFSTGRLFQGDALVASCSQEGLMRVVTPE